MTETPATPETNEQHSAATRGTDGGKPVVLLADKLSQSTVDALGEGVEVRWVDGPNRPALLAAVAEADALLVRSATTVDREVLEAAPRLKVVGRAGVGLDNVDIPAATERGVMVVNAPTSNIHSAAEHAIALLLTVARQVPAAYATLQGGEWKRSAFKGVELRDKVVGIVGFGHIGQLVAQRLRAFQTTVIAYDPYANPARAASMGVELTELTDLMARADFVSVHLPKTKETAGMFDAEMLAHAKEGQIFVNASRGGLVDEDALANALTDGPLWGAGLDVFADEPVRGHRLFELPNFVATPHLGASTKEAQDRAGTDVAASVLKALAGEFVSDAVNVSGGAVSEEVALWLPLARKLGLVARTFLDKAPVKLQVIARGELSNEKVGVLGLAALRGVFEGVVEGDVTFVNAPQIAQTRGVSYTTITEPETLSHRSTLVVTAIDSEGHQTSVVGTLTGLERVEKIVRLDGRGLDMRASGWNIALRYSDVPGALGKAGTILGNEGINIDAAALAQTGKNNKAILVLRVDKEARPEILAALEESLDGEIWEFNLD